VFVVLQAKNLYFSLYVLGQSVHTYLGESTVLECRSAFSHSVLWRYSEPHSESSQILYWGRIYGKDPRRFEVLSSNSATRTFDLSIRNVTFSDAGIYRCTENSGKYPGEVRFRLTVRGQWINVKMISCTREAA